MAQAKLVLYTNKNIYFQTDSFQLIPAFIDTDSSFNPLTSDDVTITILNGNDLMALINPTLLVFNMLATGSLNILVQYDDEQYAAIINIQIIAFPVALNKDDFFYLIKQESPQEVYNYSEQDGEGNFLPVYTDTNASAVVINNFYKTMYNIFNQIYPYQGYTNNWEFELNNTNSIFSNLSTRTQLINLLYQSWNKTALNVFDLELFFTTYIYYRTEGATSAVVYIEDNSFNFDDFWILGVSTLGDDTVLSPNLLPENKCKVIIFNTLTTQLQSEITGLVQRYIPANLTYEIHFTDDDPTDAPYDLTNIGNTYQFDNRLIYKKALQFTNGQYPFNLIGYN